MGTAAGIDLTAEVLVVRWPAEESQREDLRERRIPRVWLVEGGAPPPESVDWLEDWVRVPVAEADLAARTANVADRACGTVDDRRGPPAGATPVLDDDGVLRLGPAWVPLPPVEHRLTAALIERFGAVVNRDALALAGWPAGAPGRNALDVHVLRLRRRLRPLGLEIRTVRSRGYLLEAAVAVQSVANLA